MKKQFSLVKISRKQAERCRELYTPMYESDIEASRKFDTGQEIVGSASKKDLRNIGHHRKLFALLKLTFCNLPVKYQALIKNADELLTEIKLQIGHREKRVSLGGQEYYVPKSIAFHNLGQEAFDEFYNKTLDFICEYLLPGVDRPEIEAQIVEFM